MHYLLSSQAVFLLNFKPIQKGLGDICIVDYLEG